MSIAKSHILQHEENKKFLASLDYMLNRIETNSINLRVRVIDRDKDDLLIELIRVNSYDETTYKYVRVKDTSTGKLVFLSVPPSFTRCREAIAWTFDISLSKYELIFET